MGGEGGGACWDTPRWDGTRKLMLADGEIGESTNNRMWTGAARREGRRRMEVRGSVYWADQRDCGPVVMRGDDARRTLSVRV